MILAALRLRSDFKKILIPEIPGHGRSPLPSQGGNAAEVGRVLVQCLGELIQEPVVLYGNSLGGVAAIRLSNQFPERVKLLILASLGGAPLNPFQFEKFFSLFQIRGVREADRLIDWLFASPPQFRWFLKWYLDYRFNRVVIREFIDKITASDLLQKKELTSLKVPSLIIWGKKIV